VSLSHSRHEANPSVGIILDPLLTLFISPLATAHFWDRGNRVPLQRSMPAQVLIVSGT